MKKFSFGMLLLSVLGSLALSCTVKADFVGNLAVEIDGLKNTKGQVCLSLFANSQGFPSNGDRALKKQCVKITENPLSVKFDNIKAGSYAVVIYHDENGDKKFNRNSMGMPIEGFGFSQNPEVKASAPKFGDAVFMVAGPNTKIKIQLKYMGG
jgi:uncharacterized protein (DUF2141 family)